jgi:hypothetical protein
VNQLVAGTPRPSGRILPVTVATIALAGSHLARSLDLPLLPCPVHATTGLWCAGCGSGRALAALSTGDVALAFRQQPLLVVGLGALVLDFVAHLGRLGRSEADPGRPAEGSTPRSPRGVLVGLAAVALVFMVLRNLPALEVLAPVEP